MGDTHSAQRESKDTVADEESATGEDVQSQAEDKVFGLFILVGYLYDGKTDARFTRVDITDLLFPCKRCMLPP